MKFSALFFAALLMLAGCSKTNPRVVTRLNGDAALAGGIPSNPLHWKVITSAVNTRDSTMSTLFGNDLAVEYARAHSRHDYPTGSVVSLVTWQQQEDPRWFGGRIPKAPRSVEFVKVEVGADTHPVYKYEDFEGSPLRKVSAEEGAMPNERASYLLSQRAAVMP